MAGTWSTPPDFVPLQTLTDTVMDALSADLAALWPYTAAGQIAISSAADQLGVLAASLADALKVLRVNAAGDDFELADVVSISDRQGGNATDWSTPGTSNYTPSAAKLQAGVVTIVMSGTAPNASGYAVVTFPSAFSAKPIVMATHQESYQSSGLETEIGVYSISTTGFVVWLNHNANASAYGNQDVAWLAIGPP